MVSEERKEFAKMRRKMLCRTGSKQFICARCGLASKSVNIHHIEELHQGGENKTENMSHFAETAIENGICATMLG